jgi:hypothetical protein
MRRQPTPGLSIPPGEGGCPCAAQGLTEDGGPGSFEPAVIRSGSAPGSFTVTRAVV